MIDDNVKILIWGTGNKAREYLQSGEVNDDQIVGFVQSHPMESHVSIVLNSGVICKRVFSPKDIGNLNYDYILVCIYGEVNNIISICKRNNIPLRNIFFIDNYEWCDGTSLNATTSPQFYRIIEQDDTNCQKLFPAFYNLNQHRKSELDNLVQIYKPVYDAIDDKNILVKPCFDNNVYKFDYLRYRTFDLVANEIIENDIPGCCAEVGVFQGTFSRVINAKFADRKMYLFDTFCSFDEDEFYQEVKEGNCEETFIDIFKNTSVEFVMNQMCYPQNCIPRIGLFPDTAFGLEEEHFAFVSIDVDFEVSIFESLKFFYPRVNQGGFIFIHDYNSSLHGVKKAIKRYESEYNIKFAKMPLADYGGTLVICKF